MSYGYININHFISIIFLCYTFYIHFLDFFVKPSYNSNIQRTNDRRFRPVEERQNKYQEKLKSDINDEEMNFVNGLPVSFKGFGCGYSGEIWIGSDPYFLLLVSNFKQFADFLYLQL